MKLRGNAMLVLTAMIWGSAFVAQRSGMEYIGPFTFNGIRALLGGFVLLILVIILTQIQKKKQLQLRRKKMELANSQADASSDSQAAASSDSQVVASADSQADASAPKNDRKALFIGGILCGIILFAASSLQQIGLVYTEAGKASFITALYIVLVPLFGIFTGKRIKPLLWLCVFAAVFGLYLLCIKKGFSIGKGDLYVIACAIVYTFHILVIDHFTAKVNGVKMSCIQMFVCGIISIPFMLILETIDVQLILQCWLPICYAGILSCGVAYTLQIIAQKYTKPTVASLLMSLESVFGLLAGWILLGEQLSGKELAGCLIMFAAIIASQLPFVNGDNDPKLS